eukprot:g2062.t1
MYFFYAWRRGMQLRIAALTMVYENLLSLRLDTFATISTGHVVNLASVDIERLQMAGIFFPFLVWAPTEALLIFIFMFREVGFGSIFGFGILLLGIPVTSYFGKIFADVRIQCAVKTDERNKIVREVVDGIRVVKGNAFEEAFFERIKRIRCEEIGKVHRRARMLALNEGIFTSMPCLVLLSTFFVASLLGEHVTPRKIFVMLSLANIIQLNLTKFFTFSIQNAAEGLITFKRLKDYLILTHSEKAQKVTRVNQNPLNKDSTEQNVIVLNNASYSYGDSSSKAKNAKIVLSNLSFEVKSNELIGICGKVGSGKSSLLLSILGETVLEAGTIGGSFASGKISIGYAAQEPWMRSATIRENILFGADFDEARYEQVLQACALKEDLNSFEKGDETVVGEKGINLSGGQKARVALARACYQNSSLYLLDDPLSAVDTIVAEHLFEQCIKKLLKSTTRVIVTHQVQFLPRCDRVIILDDKDGRVKHIGTYQDLILAGVVFPTTEKTESEKSEVGTGVVESRLEMTDTEGSGGAGIRGKQQGNSVVKQEDSETGTVKLNTYQQYFFAACSRMGLSLMITLILTTQANFVIIPYWITDWAQKSYSMQQNHGYWFGTLSVFGLVLVLQAFARSILFFKLCIDNSHALFERMLRAVLYSPIAFFDSNPSGRILNRFSSDIGHIDDMLPP